MSRTLIDVDPLPRDVTDAQRRGPADERRDATIAATKELAPAARELMTSPAMAALERLGRQPNPLYDGLLRRGGVAKAEKGTLLQRLDPEHMGMAQVDTHRWQKHAAVHLERPFGFGFNQLREIVRQDVQIDLIISTRIAQMLRFLKPTSTEWQPGFRIAFKDPNREVTDRDSKRLQAVASYLQNCGLEADPRKRRAYRRDDLRAFTQKHVRDSLTMDAAPIEIIPTAGGRTHGWMAVDAATIFLTDPTFGLAGNANEHHPPQLNTLLGRLDFADPTQVTAVRNVDGVITAWYTHQDLLYPIRNPSSDERRYGYGDAEPESVIRMVTGFLNAMTYNQRALSDNSVPPGVLVMYGDFEDDDLDFLRNDWLSEVSGASNRHRLPVMVSKDKQEGGVSYVSTGHQISDVSWAKWITLLTAIKCSRYLMDPTEIAFESYHAGNSSPLNAGADTQERITSSRDKGLHTMLDWYAGTLNELVGEVDGETMIEWTGLDISKEEALAREKDLSTFGELRAKYGMSATDVAEELLNAPLNPALTGIYNITLQGAAQQAMQEEAGGAGGGSFVDDDGTEWRRADDDQDDQDDDQDGQEDERGGRQERDDDGRDDEGDEPRMMAKAQAPGRLYDPYGSDTF